MPRNPSRRSPRKPGARPSVEALEDRLAPAVFTVVTTADNGSDTAPLAGSLRAAIVNANNHANETETPDRIEFDLRDDDPGHVYYRDDAAEGQTTLANVTRTES